MVLLQYKKQLLLLFIREVYFLENNKYIIHVIVNLGGGIWSVIKNLTEYQLKKGYKVGLMYPDYHNNLEINILSELSSNVVLIPIPRKNIKGLTQVLGMPIRKTYIDIQNKN